MLEAADSPHTHTHAPVCVSAVVLLSLHLQPVIFRATALSELTAASLWFNSDRSTAFKAISSPFVSVIFSIYFLTTPFFPSHLSQRSTAPPLPRTPTFSSLLTQIFIFKCLLFSITLLQRTPPRLLFISSCHWTFTRSLFLFSAAVHHWMWFLPELSLSHSVLHSLSISFNYLHQLQVRSLHLEFSSQQANSSWKQTWNKAASNLGRDEQLAAATFLDLCAKATVISLIMNNGGGNRGACLWKFSHTNLTLAEKLKQWWCLREHTPLLLLFFFLYNLSFFHLHPYLSVVWSWWTSIDLPNPPAGGQTAAGLYYEFYKPPPVKTFTFSSYTSSSSSSSSWQTPQLIPSFFFFFAFHGFHLHFYCLVAPLLACSSFSPT